MRSQQLLEYFIVALLVITFLCSSAPNFLIAQTPVEPSSLEAPSEKEKVGGEKEGGIDGREDWVSQDTGELTPGDLSDKDAILKDLTLSESQDESKEPEEHQLGSADQLIESELQRIMAEFGEDGIEVPPVFLSEVKGYIRLFQANLQYQKFVVESLKRSSKYLPLARAIFREKGIPEDMAYIAFIESGFNPRAVSSAGAAGMWQFMPKTAREYTLKVIGNTDERFDPIKATYAAIEYFRDLISIFGPRSFLLAMAAYNCGEGKIISCLKGIDNPFRERDFWHIRSCLPAETREFPAKIIASVIIGNNPEVLGFPRFEDQLDDNDVAVMLAEYKTNKTTLKPTNLALVSTRIEGEKGVKASIKSKNNPKFEAPKPMIYRVKQGNSLSAIAEVFGVEMVEIKRWNKMKDDRVLTGQQLRIYPKGAMEQVRYTLKKGDTTSEIGSSFGVRPKNIVTCNGLKNGWEIRSGQTLVFYKPIEREPLMYTVPKGANLTLISGKFNVPLKELIMWNNLNSVTLRPGQKLKIYKTFQNI